MAQKTGLKGHADQSGKTARTFGRRERPLGDMLIRALMGQVVNPPNTAIATPLQQAISNLQGGSGQLARSFGIGGQPLGTTGGLETRAQMGLPDRKDYFTWIPTQQQVEAIGGVPPVRPPQTAKKEKKKVAAGKEIP